MNLEELRSKPARFIVGLMSGSSSDGLDAALVRIKGTGPGLAMKLIAHKHFPYTPWFRTRLLAEHMDAKEICLLNFELGDRFADAVVEMLKVAEENDCTVDFVASHGHTVAHYPPATEEQCGTLQIGESAVVAERTGLPVVSDFRPRDMAAGGQGAPLVTYADWVLFRKLENPVACLNIGGIVNFTVVTPEFDDVIAFDTGPGNMAIDGAVRLLTRGTKEMDKDGEAAAKGMVIDEFLEYLLSPRYFRKVPPKSTGREEFGAAVYLRDALAARREQSYEDLVATVTHAVAQSISDAFKRFIQPQHDISHIVVGGGGAKNRTLMKLLRKQLRGVNIFTSDQYGIPIEAREAIAFAILGNETVCGTPANVPRATGARRQAVLGKITPP
ncbi:MAG TPA: anhydro-N-acetylmuramic acid kinase [Candidatus Hydrogenedentes bacterium]|nr:anhydro-N-acetylmuramic acid kinase [Candidatus Hydrogenedentota bacterium]